MAIETLVEEINKTSGELIGDWLITLGEVWWKIAISKLFFYIIAMVIDNGLYESLQIVFKQIRGKQKRNRKWGEWEKVGGNNLFTFSSPRYSRFAQNLAVNLTKTPDNLALVDFSYVFNQWVIGIFLFQQSLKEGYDIKPFLLFLALSLWNFRLGGMIFFKRILPNNKDPRYQKILENKNKYVFGFIQFQFQGFVIMVTSCCLYFAFRMAQYDNTGFWLIGLLVIMIGIIGEAVADTQLDNFRAKGIRGAIMCSGLWKYSRHPNLFFELVVWTGFSICGLHNNGVEYLGFISVVFLWAIMKFLTVPITEKYMRESRPVTFPEFCKRSNEFLIFRCKKDPPLSQEMAEAFKGGEAGKKMNAKATREEDDSKATEDTARNLKSMKTEGLDIGKTLVERSDFDNVPKMNVKDNKVKRKTEYRENSA